MTDRGTPVVSVWDESTRPLRRPAGLIQFVTLVLVVAGTGCTHTVTRSREEPYTATREKCDETVTKYRDSIVVEKPAIKPHGPMRIAFAGMTDLPADFPEEIESAFRKEASNPRNQVTGITVVPRASLLSSFREADLVSLDDKTARKVMVQFALDAVGKCERQSSRGEQLKAWCQFKIEDEKTAGEMTLRSAMGEASSWNAAALMLAQAVYGSGKVAKEAYEEKVCRTEQYQATKTVTWKEQETDWLSTLALAGLLLLLF